MISYGVIVLCIILGTGNAATNSSKPDRGDSAKNVSNPPPLRINLRATSFKDVVENSDLVFDRSLLIKYILEAGSVVSLTYPRKSGKTVNLDMLKTFLELPVDSDGNVIPLNGTWGYHYFTRGKVATRGNESSSGRPSISSVKSIMDEYFGKYPVICMDISELQPKTEDLESYFEHFRGILSRTFRKHEYLVEALKKKIASVNVSSEAKKEMEKKLENFKQYMKEEINDVEGMSNGLQFLSQLLHEHFAKPVFVLIDNYDHPIRDMIFKAPSGIKAEDVEKFLDFYSQFVTKALKTKEILRSVVLTGVFNIDSCLVGSDSKSVANLNALSKCITRFYSFTKIQVKELHKWVSRRESSKAVERYCGHNSIFCDLWSVLNFVVTKKLDNFKKEIEEFSFFPATLRQDVLEFMITLVYGNTNVTMNRDDLELSREDLMELKKLSFGNINSVIGLYLSAGYLCSNNDSKSGSNITIEISSKEKENIIVEALIGNYQRNIFNEEIKRLAEVAADKLVESFDTPIGNQSELLNALKNLYVKHEPCNIEKKNMLTLLYVKYKYDYNIGFKITYRDKKEGEERQIYMTIYGNGHGVIYDYMPFNNISLKHEVWNRARSLVNHESFFKGKGVKFARFMVIAHDSDNNLVGAVMMNGNYTVGSSNIGNNCNESDLWTENFSQFHNCRL